MHKLTLITAALLLPLAAVTGCQDKYAAVLPQRDPALRKTRADLRTDAAQRSYPADAVKKHTDDIRAQVGYALNVLEVGNLTDTDWTDNDVWVNQRYVMHVPTLHAHQIERLWFRGIYDQKGNSFPEDNLKTLIKKVEVYHDGILHDIKVQLAD